MNRLILVTGGSGSGKSAWAEKRVIEIGKGPYVYLATMRPQGEEAKERILRHREMRAGKGFVTLERYTDLDGMILPADLCGGVVLLEDLSNLLANEMFGSSPQECCDEESCAEEIQSGKSKQRQQSAEEIQSGKSTQRQQSAEEIQSGKCTQRQQSAEEIPSGQCTQRQQRAEDIQSGLCTQRSQYAEKILEGLRVLRQQCAVLVIVTNEIFHDGIRYDPVTTSYMRTLAALNLETARMADEVTEVVCGLPLFMKGRKNSI